jgi:hypothetical protein
MRRMRRFKFIAGGLILFWILFCFPFILEAQLVGKGNLIGFVYEDDGATPVEGAVVKMRNISTGSVYESGKSSKIGLFKFEEVDEGLYLVGVSTEEGAFNLENLIGIKADEMAKVSVALKSNQSHKSQQRESETKKKGLAGFFLSPAGIAVIVASSVAVVYSVVKLTEEEPEASPFKK